MARKPTLPSVLVTPDDMLALRKDLETFHQAAITQLDGFEVRQRLIRMVNSHPALLQDPEILRRIGMIRPSNDFPPAFDILDLVFHSGHALHLREAAENARAYWNGGEWGFDPVIPALDDLIFPEPMGPGSWLEANEAAFATRAVDAPVFVCLPKELPARLPKMAHAKMQGLARYIREHYKGDGAERRFMETEMTVLDFLVVHHVARGGTIGDIYVSDIERTWTSVERWHALRYVPFDGDLPLAELFEGRVGDNMKRFHRGVYGKLPQQPRLIDRLGTSYLAFLPGGPTSHVRPLVAGSRIIRPINFRDRSFYGYLRDDVRMAGPEELLTLYFQHEIAPHEEFVGCIAPEGVGVTRSGGYLNILTTEGSYDSDAYPHAVRSVVHARRASRPVLA